MPYPSKTSRQAILDTALSILERDGLEAVSMRTIAATLHLAPNALYRYYADHNTLLAAIGNEGMRQLLEAQRGAVNPGPVTLDTIRNVAFAYLRFARQHRALYQIIMVKHQVADEYLTAYAELDSFTFSLLRQIVDETVALEAGVALWGYLHGMISIEQLDLYREGKPRSSIEFGLNALLVGIMHVKTTNLSSASAPEETPLSFPVATVIAGVAETVAKFTHQPPALTHDVVEVLREDFGASSVRAERELGIHFRPIEETLHDMVERYHSNGYVS